MRLNYELIDTTGSGYHSAGFYATRDEAVGAAKFDRLVSYEVWLRGCVKVAASSPCLDSM